MSPTPTPPETAKRLPHTDWATQTERGSLMLLKLMTWITLHLGRSVSRLVLHLIATYFLLFSPASCAASRTYLKRVLGRKPTWRDRYLHIFAFATTIHDRAYLLNQRYDIFDITIHNEQIVLDAMKAGPGVFLVGAHMGSFEVLRTMGRRLPGVRVVTLMYEENARKINAMLAAINPASMQDSIPLGQVDSMLRVREQLNHGAVICMLADRTLGDDATLWVPFLGDNAQFPIGPFRTAALLGQSMIFMVGLYRGGNRYEIHFEQLANLSVRSPLERDAAIHTAVAHYAALLERHCRSAPYNWFNFFDFWLPPQSR